MIIRPARRKDLQQITVLYEEFLAMNAEAQPEFYRGAEVPKSYPASILRDKDAALYVAADDNTREVLGFLYVVEDRTPPYEAYVRYHYATVVDIYVAPGHRGKGLGRSLMEAARQWAAERGLAYLELMVLESYVGARTFYRQQGFAEMYRVMRSPTTLAAPGGEEAPASPAMEAAAPAEEAPGEPTPPPTEEA